MKAIIDPFEVGMTVIVWTATDPAGNIATTSQHVMVEDRESPLMDPLTPVDPLPTDPQLCSVVYAPVSPGCTDNCGKCQVECARSDGRDCFLEPYELGTTTITWTATDAALNSSTMQQELTVRDLEAPIIEVAGDLEPVLANAHCQAMIPDMSGATTVTDNCDSSLPFDQNPPAGTTVAPGDHVITLTAFDSAGNEAEHREVPFTVRAATEARFTVQLAPNVDGPCMRLVEFEVTDPSGEPPMIFREVLPFDGGMAHEALVIMPLPADCRSLEGACIRARDPLHTLFGADSLTIDGDRYVAGIMGDHALVGGNYLGDNVIDILDYGVLFQEWERCYGENPAGPDCDCNTDENTPFPHADASGDGMVLVGDLTFIVVNFLRFDEDCMGGRSRGADLAFKERITVEEALGLGFSKAAAADVNHDGWLDMQDMTLILSQPDSVSPRTRQQSPPNSEPIRRIIWR